MDRAIVVRGSFLCW
uniref:Uncharacterized protein n=1 Tax=Arundo donax TaxID=35708 RepID=A0A0A9AYN1_ARUDO